MTEKNKTKISIEIENVIKALINENGFDIVDIDVIGGKNITLLLYANNSFGTDELGKLSKSVYPILESLPSLKNGFTLELSSPGIYRNIKYIKEFNIFKGRIIKVITNALEELTGISCGYVENSLELEIDGKVKKILLNDIKTAKLNG